MQKSTDTLVDEASLVNKLAILNGNQVKTTVASEDAFEEDDLFDLNNKNSINNRMNSRLGSNGSLVLLAQKTAFSQTSSTPLSSSIPSPASLTIHNNLKKSFYNNGINSVSTSTSGLSDYVTSAKFRMINDTIKYFEKSFNEENNFHDSCSNNNNNNNKASLTDENIQSKENGCLVMKRQASNSIPIAKKNVKQIF